MKTLTLRTYKDAKKEFRWTLIGANGEKLCSGESYKRRVDMEKTIVLVFLGKYLACGSRSLETVLNFRRDIELKDLTGPKVLTKRCKGKCK